MKANILCDLFRSPSFPAALNRMLQGTHNNQPLKSPLNLMNAKHLKTKNNFYYASPSTQEQLEVLASSIKLFSVCSLQWKIKFLQTKMKLFQFLKKSHLLVASGGFDQGYKFKWCYLETNANVQILLWHKWTFQKSYGDALRQVTKITPKIVPKISGNTLNKRI